MADQENPFPWKRFLTYSACTSILYYAGYAHLVSKQNAVKLQNEINEQGRMHSVTEIVKSKKSSLDPEKNYMISGMLLKDKGRDNKTIHHRTSKSQKKERTLVLGAC